MSSQPLTKPALERDKQRPQAQEMLPSSSHHPNLMPPSPSLGYRNNRSRKKWVLIGLVPLLVLGSVAAYFFLPRSLFASRPYYNGLTEKVKREKFQIRVVERGELESADNGEVYCQVESTSKLSSFTIKWVIEDGTYVKKGDLLMELDSSSMEKELLDQEIKLNQALADKIKAEQEYEIVVNDNNIEILKAKNLLTLAEIELKKFLEGDYIAKKVELEKKLADARSQLEMAQDKYTWIMRLYKRGYFNENQVKTDEFKMHSAERDLKLFETQLMALNKFEFQKMEIDLKSKIEEARLGVKKALATAESKRVQAASERDTKKSIWEQERDKRDDIRKQIENCKIYAPRTGLCVYYISPQQRWGRGRETLIAQGESVQYNQKLMLIPDLSRMQVKTNVNEAMVAYLRGADSQNPSEWQKALIRVDAFNDRIYKGHVQSVATIPSSMDWSSADVKVYATMVSIDETVEKLRPGMSAEVTIFAYESPEPVLTIPIQAVVGSITMGRTRKCYVIDENGYATERDITLGMSNESVVEIVSGLKEGERVALDPSQLIQADSGLRPAAPPSKKGLTHDDSGGPGEGGGKFKGKGKGMPPGLPGQDGGEFPGGKGRGKKQFSKGGPNEGGAEKMAEMFQQFQNASPEKRREMINNIPEQYRGQVADQLKKKGLEIAD